ncbi:transcriptional regulator RcsA [Ewingella americana]|jgi:LuxR family capsular biosynthesis transcriptional activator|uniref:Transcriptional regulator RcsA n=1 Tax=Ewingella americana TaxID=41202 RepID=A0A502GJN9_9GAMM|nr:transcriptional regulator RcsA [Ewingella americana]TPG62021.1 transcriptional regulator RcsA [Ewingella americana]
MSSLIVDKCHYTQLALQSLLQINGLKKKDILSLTEINELQASCNGLSPDIIFINEDSFTYDPTIGEVLRDVINKHPQTLFFIFISKENLNYQNYIPIRNNIIILTKSIRTQLVYRLIEHNRQVKVASTNAEVLDLTPVSLSRTEADILKMWMSGHNTLHISQHLNIKEKTVSSHKGNIKRKVKTQNKQAIYHVVKLADALTSGMFVGRVRPFRKAITSPLPAMARV